MSNCGVTVWVSDLNCCATPFLCTGHLIPSSDIANPKLMQMAQLIGLYGVHLKCPPLVVVNVSTAELLAFLKAPDLTSDNQIFVKMITKNSHL